MGWAEHATRLREIIQVNAYNVVGMLEGKKPLEMHWNIWKDNIEMDQM